VGTTILFKYVIPLSYSKSFQFNSFHPQSGDTVASIAEMTNTTTAGLISWNPELSTGTPSGLVVGTAICVLFPTGNYTLFPAPIPSNLAQAAKVNTSTCGEYYTVQSGDSCAGIETKFNLTNDQFLALNPNVTAQCTNIVLGKAYCVLSIFASGPVITGPPANVAAGTITTNCTGYYTVVSGDSCGTIETKFNITAALFHSMNPELTSTCSNLVIGDAYCIGTSNATSTVGSPSNLASGSLANCTTYDTLVSGQSCTTIVAQFTITLSDFFRWNPEVNTGCTNMILGSAYCVVGGGNPCQKTYTVVSGDSCGAIETKESVTAANLHVLNPWLDANCDIQVGQSLCVG
jgi:LysM repeat protein